MGAVFTQDQARKLRLYRYGFWKQYLCEYPDATYTEHRAEVESRKYPYVPGDQRTFSLGTAARATDWTDGGYREEID